MSEKNNPSIEITSKCPKCHKETARGTLNGQTIKCSECAVSNNPSIYERITTDRYTLEVMQSKPEVGLDPTKLASVLEEMEKRLLKLEVMPVLKKIVNDPRTFEEPTDVQEPSDKKMLLVEKSTEEDFARNIDIGKHIRTQVLNEVIEKIKEFNKNWFADDFNEKELLTALESLKK